MPRTIGARAAASLGETAAAELAGEASGEEHDGGAGERRDQAKGEQRLPGDHPHQGEQRHRERRMIHVSERQPPRTGHVVQLVAEPAVLCEHGQVERQRAQREGEPEAAM